MSTILGLIGLSPATLLAIGGAVIAALGWIWNTKRVSKAAGVAEEKARVDAANRELIGDKRRVDEEVDRLRQEEARKELEHWGGHP